MNLPAGVAPTKEGGREHDVHFDDASMRWLKFTKPSGAGYAVEIVDGALLMVPRPVHCNIWSDGKRQTIEFLAVGRF